MIQFFHTLLYQPIFNVLVLLYQYIPGHDLAIAIIVLTFIIKIVLYPLSAKALKSQKAMQELQPKLEELKVKYKNQKEVQAQKMMEFYKEEKVNPAASCLPLLIQFPILLAVFQVFNNGLRNQDGLLDDLYGFVANPGHLETVSRIFGDMAVPSVVLAVLAGAAQFWQAKMIQVKKPPKEAGVGARDESMAAAMNKQILYMMPVLTVIFGLQFPGGLSLYWLTTTLLTIGQQVITLKKKENTAESTA
ncbi:MAG: hypothetical protein COT39_00575 [Parcubacteria group bacterium CG08_land_8_20_14_0_20_48_21]|nr:MAG: hypothetical protein AUK21_03790 [Parcubacteria group bacterium CG2_30_48_51]PIS33159.1 MAG: hypothetical protein COT39_00575 [Parcubacteria group bacterium CG08_land_8_20_14_0_20_48_21]PIW79402.1 MAG: hypothetical protein COZ99_01100 [Parcubacteria group bacterium CG_4_8_14_3_um_filter_48_16]PIY77662.1 MAG: hypothetical protein COY83_03925 [Parcubacteria group bacterium CG_4_10_14_0_8_um_filter_48_154]PIZ77438.1 MAG: hypothetical protein COY03_02785 [bacterium CG_4_10_14_0_2_um_filter_